MNDIMNPKMVIPPCREIWEWYNTLADRLIDANETGDCIEIDKIADEIRENSVQIEYLCKI